MSWPTAHFVKSFEFLHAVAETFVLEGVVSFAVATSATASKCSMSGVNMAPFKPVKFEFGCVMMTGGASKRPVSIPTLRASCGTVFAKLTSADTWLTQAVFGLNKATSAFSRASLLTMLREVTAKAADGEIGMGDANDEDPMADLDIEGQQPSTRGRGAKRARYRCNHAKRRIVKVDVAADPPELGDSSGKQRTIKLYITDRRTVWLCLHDVEWALRYLHVQNVLKGVPLVAPDSQGPAPCDALGVSESVVMS